MNKLLPILLVVVLSGCGGNAKTTLEKCADSESDEGLLKHTESQALRTMDESFRKQYRELQRIPFSYDKPILPIPNQWTVIYLLKNIGVDKTDRYIKDWEVFDKEHNKLFDSFRDKKLSDKLYWSFYEEEFKNCENDERLNPKTFDAKWK
tara:strand:+ start:794 stop:1243 length:450 start_codon:yes stop_codon:yes gene_type:complete